MNRRSFLGQTAKAGIGTITIGSALASLESCEATKNIIPVKHTAYGNNPGFQQRPLTYAFNALEPYIDAETMELHYTKHAVAYTKNMNEAILTETPLEKTLEAILKNISKYSDKLRNNAGGHYNHESFWSWMTPSPKPMNPALLAAVTASFQSLDNLKQGFNEQALHRFGSGWAWLVVDANKKLVLGNTPNQDNPLMDISEFKGFPILGIDVWEHAYYLKYQNKRADYINAWWNVINWQEVENRFNFAMRA